MSQQNLSKLVLLVSLLLPLVAVTCNPERTEDISGVPSWGSSAIWYQIFPERFNNGDPTNDPAAEDMFGSWPHMVPPGWKVSDWTGDWYALQEWERTDDKGFYFHVQNRRYGGDLQGILDKLDYLDDLGITAIYLNPIFESPSLHKYDATFYHHVDNNFGPDPEGDKKIWKEENPADPSTWKWTSADSLFLRLITQAHARGMKIVIDGVFNHVGMTFWAFEDVKKNQEKSLFKDWFTIKRWDDPTTPENEFDYEGWFGVRELPELREDGNGIVTGPREHIFSVVRRWMDPNGDGNPDDGIDGWRLDVAEKVNKNFWRDFRTLVRSINCEAVLVGEVWWEDWDNDKMFNAAPWLQGDVFDGVMNYRWAREAFLFFAAEKTKISASTFRRRLGELQDDYRRSVNDAIWNLYDSHDTDRMLSRIVNPDLKYDKRVNPKEDPTYDVRTPRENEKKTQKLMALFQMTFVGAPMLYYGTECGMWGADDPDCRKPMLWSAISHTNESSHPFGKNRPNDKNVFDGELLNYYRKLISIRKNHKSLTQGEYQALLVDDERDVFSFMRESDDERVLVVLNNSWRSQEVMIPFSSAPGRQEVADLMSQKKYPIEQNRVSLRLEPKSGVMLQ